MSEIKIYSGSSQIRIMEIKSMLENENISYQELDKSDSSFTGIQGDMEIYVAANDADKARHLIESTRE